MKYVCKKCKRDDGEPTCILTVNKDDSFRFLYLHSCPFGGPIKANWQPEEAPNEPNNTLP